MDYTEIINKYYPAGSVVRDIYLRHCRSVADEALAINRRKQLGLDEELVESSAMLHDIGIIYTHAPSIGCHGTSPYISHGVIGAGMLREAGVDERICAVAERHTGAGLTADEIERQSLPLPHVDLLPRTLLERLICYADKFYSKGGDMKRKPIESVRKSMARFGRASLDRFEALDAEFGQN